MGCGGARIPKSLFLVRGCRGPAPRPCAQRATLLGRGSASLRSRPSRPGTRVLPPLGARPRPGSPARIPGPSRPRGPESARGRRTGPRAPRGAAQKRVSRGEGRGFSTRGLYSVDAGVTENISPPEGGGALAETLGARPRGLPPFLLQTRPEEGDFSGFSPLASHTPLDGRGGTGRKRTQ